MPPDGVAAHATWYPAFATIVTPAMVPDATVVSVPLTRRLSTTAMLIIMMAAPNTVLTPGIETGSRKGRDVTAQISRRPCSPTPSIN